VKDKLSCTGIVESCKTSDSAANDGKQGWFKLGKVVVTLDSGIHTPSQYALNLDFVGESQDVKTTIELSPIAAKELSEIIQAALSRGVKMGLLVPEEK
jgi:hypothetical protein